MKFFRVALLSGVLMTSGGCLFQKSPQVQVPVPPPAPIPAPTPEEQAPPPPVAVTPPPTPAPSTPTPSTPEPAKPSPFPPATTPPPTRAVTPPPARPPQTSAPALGVVLSAADKTRYENAYKADTDSANSLLEKLNGRGLTAEQRDSLSRARALLKQSAQYHNRDLTTSAELARRARVLLQDLAEALK